MEKSQVVERIGVVSASAKPALFIGLTGGIAAGKSAVVDILKAGGYHVIDCDALARAVLEKPSPALAEVRRCFGDTVFSANGDLDRQALAGIVFRNPEKRRLLEEIVHPVVERELQSRAMQLRERGAKVVFADVPLLFEVGWQKRFDKIWLVMCADEIRVQRLMKRDGISEAFAKDKFAAQISQAEKSAWADVVIDNSGTRDELLEKVQRLMNDIV